MGLLVDHLRVEYRLPAATVVALRDVSLGVEPGEFVALAGPSGSGKSTLLAACAGLTDISSGRVLVDGDDVGGMSQDRRAEMRRTTVGVVFQDPSLLGAFTALENVTLPMELFGGSAREAQKTAYPLMERLGIVELAGRFPGEMSGGQQQRVGIARALVGGRGLLLADEPTAALDDESARSVTDLLHEECEKGLAVLVATHDPRVAGVTHRTVAITGGRIVDDV